MAAALAVGSVGILGAAAAAVAALVAEEEAASVGGGLAAAMECHTCPTAFDVPDHVAAQEDDGAWHGGGVANGYRGVPTVHCVCVSSVTVVVSSVLHMHFLS